MTAEEWKFKFAVTYGVHTPAIVGQTTIESLKDYIPSWPGTARGIRSTVKTSMDIMAAGRKLDSAEEMRRRVLSGAYVSFRSLREKALVLRHWYANKRLIKNVEFEGGQNAILRQLVAGDYKTPEAGPITHPFPKDPAAALGAIETHTLHNSTYQQTDAKRLMRKVENLLPKPAPAQPEQKAAAQRQRRVAAKKK